MRYYFISFLLLIPVLNLFSQVPVGEWRDHFSYRQAHSVAEGEHEIYVASDLALFIYDKDDYSVTKLSKINGLSDAGISHIAYNENSKILMIAYVNSNIDIIKDGQIYNFSEIKRKQISGDKSINRIIMKGDLAYLACGFGIVVFDTKNLEFSDTYFIGDDASYMNVNDLTFSSDTIYAATENGLYKTNYNTTYPGDYNNWEKLTKLPYPNGNYSLTQYFNSDLYCFNSTNSLGYGLLYVRSQNNWKEFPDSSLFYLRDINVSGEFIIFANENKVAIYDTLNRLRTKITSYKIQDAEINKLNVSSAKYASNDDLLVTDKDQGLIIYHPDKTITQILPNGPYNNKTGSVESLKGRIYSTTGSVKLPSLQQQTAGYYNIFENNEWTSYFIEDALDLVRILPNKNNPDNYFVASWGMGVYEFNNGEQTNHFTVDNSSLQSAAPTAPERYTRVFDMAFDSDNNLWLTNDIVPQSLCLKTASNDWYSYALDFDGDKWSRNLLARDNNDIWIDIYRTGLYAFNNNGTPDDLSDDKHRYFYPQTADGSEYEKEVRCIAEDKDGTIWVGTIQGLFVYYNPEKVFDSEPFYADRIVVTEFGSDTTDQYLLKTDIITDIEIDGANQKWVGTESSGIFLLGEAGKPEIHHFDMFNSPLISNTIVDIAIDKSGEVFIATDRGIMGYRGEATEADEHFEDVYVFPNPVRPGYTGLIAVTGLAEDVNVKFTDISGALVYETTAQGGQAVWDGNNFSGRRVNSGVYLVFCTDKDGSETFVTKLLFIN